MLFSFNYAILGKIVTRFLTLTPVKIDVTTLSFTSFNLEY